MVRRSMSLNHKFDVEKMLRRPEVQKAMREGSREILEDLDRLHAQRHRMELTSIRLGLIEA